MAVPQSLRVPVTHELVFPAGAMFLGVEPATDFDARARGAADYQLRDENGRRVFAVTVMDMDPVASRFGRAPTVKINVASEVQPVPPTPQAAGFNPLVAFDGLTVSPWADRSRCKASQPGREHKCRAQLAYSMWATAMVDPAELGTSPV
jgi:hypothetical protein